MCSCCGEEQPVEVKLMAAKVLVTCTSSLLTHPHLPLGESSTEQPNEENRSILFSGIQSSRLFKHENKTASSSRACVSQVCPLRCLCGEVCLCCCKMKTRKSGTLHLTSPLTCRLTCSAQVRTHSSALRCLCTLPHISLLPSTCL